MMFFAFFSRTEPAESCKRKRTVQKKPKHREAYHAEAALHEEDEETTREHEEGVQSIFCGVFRPIILVEFPMNCERSTHSVREILFVVGKKEKFCASKKAQTLKPQNLELVPSWQEPYDPRQSTPGTCYLTDKTGRYPGPSVSLSLSRQSNQSS